MKNKDEKVFDKMRIVANKIGVHDMFCLLAEECSELSQASLKCRRKISSKNNFSDVYDNLIEEIADVETIIWQLKFLLNDEKIQEKIDIIRQEKTDKWYNKIYK